MDFRLPRRCWIAACTIASLGFAACGGGDATQPGTPPTPPPPPPPPPPPSAVAVVVTPSTATVQVGRTQAFTATVTNTTNTAVTWTSSGGTLETTGTTTSWTAPAAAGTVTVTAASVADPSKTASATITVSPLDPIEVVLDDQPLGPGGGTLTVTHDDSPLSGLTIAVPAGAYAAPTRWTVSEMRDIRPVLPVGAEQVGPTIRFDNGQEGYAERPFTITLPARVPANRVVGAFYYDAATGAFDPLPLLGRTDSTIVLITRHLSRTRLVPDAASPFARMRGAGRHMAASGGSASSTEVVMLSVELEVLGGSVSTGFLPSRDDWPILNSGSWLTPAGYSAGASLSALYHFLVRRHSLGSLFLLDDPIPRFNHDNARGIRLASMIQADVMPRLIEQVSFLIDSAASVGQSWAVNQARALALNIWMRGSPRVVLVGPRGRAGRAQALIAFDMNNWKFGVSSTQEPGTARQITFTGTEWEPFLFAASADEPPEPYGEVFMLGHSALLDLAEIEAYWAAYDAGTIGNGRFPALRREYRTSADSAWIPMPEFPDRLVSASESLWVRTLCSGCDFKRPAPAHADRIITAVYTMTGELVDTDVEDGVEGSLMRMPTLAPYTVGLFHSWRPTSDGTPKTIDWTRLNTERVEFELTSEPEDPATGETATFRLENGGIGDASMQYRWLVGDQTPVWTPFSQPTLRRTIEAGTNRVVVELVDEMGRRRARAELRLSPAGFRGLGFGLTFAGLSADGAVLVGGSAVNNRNRPIRWTEAQGLQTIGTDNGDAFAVSADGSVVVGRLNGSGLGAGVPFRWTAEDGMQVLADSGTARGVSADGSVVVGEVRHQAFLWTAAGGRQSLDGMGASAMSAAHAVSSGGDVVVGWRMTSDGQRRGFRWTSGTMQLLNPLGPGYGIGVPNSEAHDVSADGSIVVGRSTSPEGQQGIRWMGGMSQGFGVWPSGFPLRSWACCISDDGSRVVGNVTGHNSDAAFIWTAERGIRDLKTVLEQEYGLDLTGWLLYRVEAISANGRVMVGVGRNPQGQYEGWRAVLPVSTGAAPGIAPRR